MPIDNLKSALAGVDPATPVFVQLGPGGPAIALTAADLQTALGIPAPANAVQPAPTPQPQPMPTPPTRRRVQVNSPFLRIRERPTINSREVSRLMQNDIVEVAANISIPADGFNWLQLGDGRGFIAGEYTSLAEPIIPFRPTESSFMLPFAASQRGVGASAGGWAPGQRELDLAKRNRVEVVLMCAYQLGQAARAVQDFRNIGARHFIVRAALNNVTGDPNDFINRTLPCLREYEAAIGRDGPFMIAVHNEPNIAPEGWNSAWRDGFGFSNWFLAVAAAYRQQFRNAKIGFPALSPGGDVPGLRMDEARFIAGCGPAINASDWVGVHCYWTRNDGSDITLPLDKWRVWYGNKPIVGTEVGPADGTNNMGRAMRLAYDKFAMAGIPAIGWVLNGAGAWQNAAWDLLNVIID
jgi:hypothetical protein